jgi:hypothetical protein
MARRAAAGSPVKNPDVTILQAVFEFKVRSEN